MRNLCLALPMLLVAGCAMAPPEPAQASCAAARFPENPRIAGWSVDKFAGTYTSGNQALRVWREGHRLLIERPGKGIRELATDNLDSGKFRDGCGETYQFILPPDGPGAMLHIQEHPMHEGFGVWHRAT